METRTGAAFTRFVVKVPARGGGAAGIDQDRIRLAGVALLDPAEQTGRQEALGRGNAALDLAQAHSAVASAQPHITFMFCTACPAAPFTRLSSALIRMMRPVRGIVPPGNIEEVRVDHILQFHRPRRPLAGG